MRVEEFNDAIYKLSDVIMEWYETCEVNKFDIYIDIATYYKDIDNLISSDDSVLLVLYNNDNEPIGYIGIVIQISPLDNSKIAVEHYWYVLENYRGMSSIKLLHSAKKWAKEQGCSNIIFTASNIASELHDKVCNLYERLGMKKIETSYIQKL